MKILMCRPDYFGVEYEINPWMDIAKQVNHGNALKQWQTLHDTLIKCGAQIELATPIEGWPDMTFTANAGLYYQNKIILAHFKHKERQGEEPYFYNWFLQNNFEVLNSHPNHVYFEGAGDALLAGNKLFAGFGFRTDKEFYKAPYIDQNNLVYCELTDPYFYHIDTCFCPLDAETAIWYPSAFTKDSQERMSKEINLFAVEEEEAKRFACNAIVIEKNIILPTGCPKISALLAKQGFNIYQCDMDEYLKAGGACKCLTMRLD